MLSPGDMAVIVARAGDPPEARDDGLYGKIVVLARVCDLDHAGEVVDRPAWIVSGIGSRWHCIGQQSLRKIPPAPMLEIPEPVEAVT